MPSKDNDSNLNTNKKIEKIQKLSNNSTKKVVKEKSASSTSKSTAKKTLATKKETTKVSVKQVSKKSTTSKRKKEVPVSIVEYYDLPYKYNQTVVKILAQTPNILFVYWEISQNDIDNYISNFGDSFFHETKPVLIIHNNTKNYSFELEINDFANCWYLHLQDTNCKYSVELGRRFIQNTSNNYIQVSNSNDLITPNDHILFENFKNNVKFKNVKNNIITEKWFENITNTNSIFNLYNKIYENNFEEINSNKLSNPSSKFFN